jgi:1,4-alpha-glucan branching enzyme
MEEQWLYEAITGTYLPLLQMFEGLIGDHIPYRCTVSLSAPLITMLTDDLLKVRYAAALDKLIELTEKEIDRTPEPHYQSWRYVPRSFSVAAPHPGSHEGDLVRRSGGCRRRGASRSYPTATHAFFPFMDALGQHPRPGPRRG